ncbi:MAG: CRISPR system precrRNA processing endoribonuclease RAMP protein Cas6 [Chloracidobacterium sp.]|nr:CRISPR system precrRNA processing endoribonuclease RAMP protein Cas6 [Chloracidobacterium sp.]MDW8217864.1 CRISPR system precrRNA processing endoribonuclease RAMP protein Cas6 [Acidobacteriota bacterium]
MAGPASLPSLDIARYRFTLRPQRPTILPGYPGSMLRGAFGWALKQAVCVVEHGECSRCILRESCHYPYWFETPFPGHLPLRSGSKDAPAPFLLEIAPAEYTARPTPEHPLQFGMTLIGARAQEALKYVVQAVADLGKSGLGRDRTRFRLTDVQAVDSDGAQNGRATARPLSAVTAERTATLATARRIRVTFETPTRIRVAGDLQAEVNFALLARNLLRRVTLLAEVHGAGRADLDAKAFLAAAETVRTEQSLLRWLDWERWSNRQRENLKMGGFLGEIVFSGDALPGFAPWLAAGEVLHVGTGTTLGLGRMRVEPLLDGTQETSAARRTSGHEILQPKVGGEL